MLLVTGATGNIGRDLVRELDAKGADVRILTRDPARAAALPDRVERVVGDLDEPATLPPAFAGVEGMFLLTPGLGTTQVAHAVAAAQDAGLRHIVHLSSSNVLVEPMPAMGRWHHEREEIVRACRIPATFLRPGGFMLNTLEWLPTIREGGYVLDATGPGRYAPIDTADIAAAAAAVLTEDGHAGQAYDLSGEELFTIAGQVAVISKTIGRDLQVRRVSSAEEAVKARFANGAPPALAEALVEGFELMAAGALAYTTDNVRKLIGRAPRTFADWCTRNAAAFQEAADS